MKNDQVSYGGSIQRAFTILKALGAARSEGIRVTQLAKSLAMTPATVHRLLQVLISEGMVEQDHRTKVYRLSLELFCLGASAVDGSTIRAKCRPALLRLGASLGDTIFLLVRSGFDAVCLDRFEGPFPIRSFTGDIGGRVALGIGQASMAILANLHPEEQEEVIRYNLPRMRSYGVFDEVYVRTEIEQVRRLGYSGQNTGVLEGMGGVAVAIVDKSGQAVAALSIGTLAERLNSQRLPTVVSILRKEAEALSLEINPFDPALRRPAHSLGTQHP